MRNKIQTLALLILISTTAFSQETQTSPTLNFTGSSPSLSKGTINTEVLTAIIQKKQEEIKQRVFKNTIISQFNNSENNYKKRLNNFATYNYLYSLMDILTSGKNKKVMTKSAIEKSAEFGFIFGLAIYTNPDIVKGAKITSFDTNKKGIPNYNRYEIDEASVHKFNVIIDMVYSIIIEPQNETIIQELFKFDDSISDLNFRIWNEKDNTFEKEKRYAQDSDPNNQIYSIQQLENLKLTTENKIKNLFENLNSLNLLKNEIQSINKGELKAKILNKYPSIGEAESKNISDDFKNKIESLLKSLDELTASEITMKINELQDKFDFLLNDNQKLLITKLTSFIDFNYDEYRQIYNFFSGLHKVNFKDFSLTQKQYNALKFILIKFINVAKNHYPNDVISTMLELLLENTIVEYNEYGNLVNNDSNSESIGYLYVDIESLIYTLDQNFSSETKRGITKYITPFFSIGTNYASFNESNSLISNNDGTQSSLSNLYFASEKLGLKWKVWNWKYTHAFKAGESFNYYGRTTHWFRPQEEPLISDFHFVAYGSGLLYNLVDLKSENNFNYAVVGAGIGITFFNGLCVNVSIASPIIDKKIDNDFINFGFDIPIIEYISALTNKK
ncbi:hypothetical protein [Marivirga arenosa]|uniref:Uncharacterized protein n=1 Tax=Marivirga arenosa TaxID=3059076 RepID=A0AA51ZUU3_9BACT|nr:hypothetical protein [Marivirga sp. BKB1-2]WNB17054.1 hypothetical protein QYS47_32750 [Marivirga sp. BKB1-2]